MTLKKPSKSQKKMKKKDINLRRITILQQKGKKGYRKKRRKNGESI